MASPQERREALKAVWLEARECTRCDLAKTRTTVVFGSGNSDADLMFVGEAPGRNEDEQGVPFVGQAGKLLDKLLGEIGLSREDVFIANTLLCRPPGNRDPLPGELETCAPYLRAKLELIQPRVVCTLGNFATKLLRGDPTGISKLHGRPEVRTIGGRTVRLYPMGPEGVEETGEPGSAADREPVGGDETALSRAPDPVPQIGVARELEPAGAAAGAGPGDADASADAKQLGLF
jgi:uracil-DNA glycosylase